MRNAKMQMMDRHRSKNWTGTDPIQFWAGPVQDQ